MTNLIILFTKCILSRNNKNALNKAIRKNTNVTENIAIWLSKYYGYIAETTSGCTEGRDIDFYFHSEISFLVSQFIILRSDF